MSVASGGVIWAAIALVVLAGPLLLWMAGWFKRRHAPSTVGTAAQWDWRMTVMSALLYVLAFNLTFFIQELFLVLPKAVTPGLRPTLFHNNHSWDGGNPLAGLFQGTGVLATLLAGLICAVRLRRGTGKSAAARLFLFWMAYSGIFMALPQFVIGALSEQSDLGMCMAYLGFGTAGKTVAALAALALIPVAAGWLRDLLLAQAPGPDRQYLFRTATLPAYLALPLIALFRIPREWIEVLLVPCVVTVIGMAWIQAGAWRAHKMAGQRAMPGASIAWPLGAVACLLLIFQVLLRPGIRFFT